MRFGQTVNSNKHETDLKQTNNCMKQGSRREYETLKLKLWKDYEHNRDAYTEAKTEFVRKWTQEALRENMNGNPLSRNVRIANIEK